MRLIDADALTGYVTELYEYDMCHDDADEYSEGRASAEHRILEKIRELPTIDAIPVEWLEAHKTEYFEDWGEEPVSVEAALKTWQKEQEANDA